MAFLPCGPGKVVPTAQSAVSHTYQPAWTDRQLVEGVSTLQLPPRKEA